MTIPVIDETKLPDVMEIIKRADFLMTEKDSEDAEIKKELDALQDKLRELTGKDQIEIESFKYYDEAVSLETAAKDALMSPPQKEELTDEQVREIVLNCDSYDDEIAQDWCFKYLELNTGLDNLTDYIFYPDLVGLDENASLEQIADKINADRK